MRINENNLEEFIAEYLNDECHEIDDFETECEFEKDGRIYCCDEIKTRSFCIFINNYDVFHNNKEGRTLIVCNVDAMYTVDGYNYEGDDEWGGYVESGRVERTNDFFVVIYIDDGCDISEAMIEIVM